MVERDVTRFEIPTEWLDEAQQAYSSYCAVLAVRHDYTAQTDADSARRKREIAAIQRRIAEAYARLAVQCVGSQPLFLAFHGQAQRFERDAVQSDAAADWFAEQAARLATSGGEAA